LMPGRCGAVTSMMALSALVIFVADMPPVSRPPDVMLCGVTNAFVAVPIAESAGGVIINGRLNIAIKKLAAWKELFPFNCFNVQFPERLDFVRV